MTRNFSSTLKTVAIATATLLSSAASAVALTGPIINPANGHSYVLLEESSWTDAQAEALALGGNLTTIDSPAEQDWIYSNFSTFGGVNRNLWIGLYDSDPLVNSPIRIVRRGEFRWVDGSPVTFTNWSSVEPNNPISGDPANPEFYVHLWSPLDPNASRWNNYTDTPTIFSIPINGVVEISPVPEPTSALLLTLGLAAVILRTRRSIN